MSGPLPNRFIHAITARPSSEGFCLCGLWRTIGTHPVDKGVRPVAELKAAKRELFCKEYIVDLNGTQAAIRAGYSEKTANSIASSLLTKIDIQQRISELSSSRMEKVKIDAEYVLSRLVEIDQMDVVDILNVDGSMKPITEWPKSWRTTLSGIDIMEIQQGDSAGVLKKIKWPDKVKNLELIGKHINVGAFEIKQRISVSEDFDKIMSADDES